MARHLLQLSAAAALLTAAVSIAAAQTQTLDVRVLPVQGFDKTMMYMLAGAGGNIAVHVGEEGILVVDTGVAAASEAVLAAIRTISDKPIRYIINTHAHPDHVGGNEHLVKESGGQRNDGGGGPGGGLQRNPNGVFVVAHDNAAIRMLSPAGGQPGYPEQAVARSTFITMDKQLHFNGEAIELWHHPSAHTDGDTIVFFRRSDVIVAGDLFTPSAFPRFDVASRGRLQGMLNGLNQIVDLAVPQFNQVGGTRIIPGHGWLSTESDVVEARDTATIIRDRVQHMVDRKMTLAEVKDARPVIDYEPVYGTSSGPWTTDRFIETVYTDLQKAWDGPGPVAKSGLNFSDSGR